MAHHCKACGGPMKYDVVKQYKIGDGGKPVLYTGVRHYTCLAGCPRDVYDFTHARPAAEGNTKIRPQSEAVQPDASPKPVHGDAAAVPVRRINVIDPIFVGGLIIGYLLFAFAILVSDAAPGPKVFLFALLTVVAFGIQWWISSSKRGRDGR